MEDKKVLYPTLVSDEYNHYVSVVEDGDIITLRLTPSEYQRIVSRSYKEFVPTPNTFMNRLKLAWAIIVSKTTKGGE
jgi:hypothetical protein